MGRIAVVGQGVMGLTSALRLLENGFSVDVYSKEAFEDTTSMAAGAYWWPHKAYPRERVSKWAKVTYDVYAAAPRESGIHFENHIRLCLDPDDGAYARHLVADWEEIDGAAYGIPTHEAYRLTLPVIDVPVFMPYLLNQLQRAGARFIIEELASPAALFPAYDLVVNCTGVWARQFVNDETVFPIRGQVVRLKLPDGLRTSTRLVQKEDRFTLVLPRTDDLVLGGTAQENDWDRQPREEDTRMIIDRCSAIVPEVGDCEVLGTAVGLRPGRREVRLELDTSSPDQPVIHNYGHGGGGFTICWGCAGEVAALASRFLA